MQNQREGDQQQAKPEDLPDHNNNFLLSGEKRRMYRHNDFTISFLFSRKQSLKIFLKK
jgi:hypothetical protein